MKNMKKRLMITAHSGCDNTPDNSMEFVAYALSIGVDAFEIDVRNFNNTLIISHDEPKDSDNLVYLSDVFNLANSKPSVGINCDLKDKNIEKMVLNLAVECNLQNKIMFSGWVSLDKTKEIQERNLGESSLLENLPEVYLNIDCLFDDFYEDRVQLAIDNGETSILLRKNVKKFYQEC